MQKNVEDYCKDCLLYKKLTLARHSLYRLLVLLTLPKRAQEETTIDFIIELPLSQIGSQVYDAILVVMCRLTKIAYYIPTRVDQDRTNLAQAQIREVICLHRVPKRIISDRGPLINAKHQDTFQYYLNLRRVLSSAYYLQTDRQTERQNQTLKQYLRCYCCLKQDNQSLQILVAEFAYNNSIYATTETTPFCAYYSVDPYRANQPSIAYSNRESPLGRQVALKVISIQHKCRKKILTTNAYQKAYADKKRLPITFKVRDQVIVSNQHIRSTRLKRKLNQKYIGLGCIIAQYRLSAFKVDLLGLNSVYLVFYALLLELYNQRGLILHLDVSIVDTLQEFSNNVYNVD